MGEAMHKHGLKKTLSIVEYPASTGNAKLKRK
jgi:hypothetical protein